MAGLPPAEFAKRLAGVRDNLAGLARNAADGVLDGMNDIAETAVKRLVERTPRSPDGETHIADGWTARKADDGPGIAPELRARLFQPFSAGDIRSGSGLGLAICQEVVRALHGTISLDNREDHGRIRGLDCAVRLPRAPADNAA